MRTPLISNAARGAAADDAPGQQVGGIVERISSAISLGMLAVGERLPAEVELAGQFGVAVATLRKALADLRSQGVVETRRGRNGGTFVVKAPFPSQETLRSALQQTSVSSLRDLADEHAAVSSAAAMLAAERTAPGKPTRLAELVFRARETRGAQDRALADSRFHIEIAVLSHSQRLLTAEQRLQSEIAPLLWSDSLVNLPVQQAFNDHLAIVMAIEQGRADDASKLAQQHVMSNIRSVIDAKLAMNESLRPGTHATRTSISERKS